MENSPTVFIVSQRASSIQYADKIIVLDDGRIAGIGSHDSLLESCGYIRKYIIPSFLKTGRRIKYGCWKRFGKSKKRSLLSNKDNQ